MPDHVITEDYGQTGLWTNRALLWWASPSPSLVQARSGSSGKLALVTSLGTLLLGKHSLSVCCSGSSLKQGTATNKNECPQPDQRAGTCAMREHPEVPDLGTTMEGRDQSQCLLQPVLGRGPYITQLFHLQCSRILGVCVTFVQSRCVPTPAPSAPPIS